MSVSALIDSLKRNNQKQIEKIWQESAANAKACKEKSDGAICALETEYEKKLAEVTAREMQQMKVQTRERKRRRILQTEQNLASRARLIAQQMLGSIRNQNYSAVFQKLVSELPGKDWETMRVNPADVELAGSCLDPAIVIPDNDIYGGLLVSKDSEAIVIDNTFEKRLVRIWADLLPDITAEICRDTEEHGTSPKNKAE